MGDVGVRCNRALHVAFLGDQVAGCISSSFATTWTEPGIGHWGMLAVDPSLQGRGIASLLVAAAERRLAEGCRQVHIEYDFVAGAEYSARLRAWYEKAGYARLGGQRSSGPRGSEFCYCRKRLSQDVCLRGRAHRLQTELGELRAQLAQLGPAGHADADEPLPALKSQPIFDSLTTFLQAKGAEVAKHMHGVILVELVDAMPRGRLAVDLSGGRCCAGALVAEPDCTLRISDEDLHAMCWGGADGFAFYWSGQLQLAGDTSLGESLFHVVGAAKSFGEQT